MEPKRRLPTEAILQRTSQMQPGITRLGLPGASEQETGSIKGGAPKQKSTQKGLVPRGQGKSTMPQNIAKYN